MSYVLRPKRKKKINMLEGRRPPPSPALSRKEEEDFEEMFPFETSRAEGEERLDSSYSSAAFASDELRDDRTKIGVTASFRAFNINNAGGNENISPDSKFDGSDGNDKTIHLNHKQYKAVNAPSEVLKNYHESNLFGEVPITLKVQRALRGGFLGYSIYIIEFLGAFLSGLFYIWATYSFVYPFWVSAGQDVVSVLFTADYFLRIYSEPSRIYYITSFAGIVDGLAVIPILTLFIGNGHGGVADLLHLMQFMRIIRIYPLLHKIGIRGSNLWQQIFLLVVSIVGLVLLNAGLFFYVEYLYFQSNMDALLAGGCDPRGCITFFEAVYFVWVTISTVGYGDITGQSEYARAVSMLIILMALIIVPLQIQRLSVVADRMPYGGTFAARKVTGARYVIISGSISYATVETFLSEFYQSTHDSELVAYLDGTYALRTIIMAPFRPSHRLAILIAKYNGLVEFIEGSALKNSDLKRIRAGAASAFFLLSDKAAENAVSEDNTQIVRALSVHRFCGPGTRIIVDVLRPETESSQVWRTLDREEHSLQVVCLDRIRYRMLSRSCFVRGLHTFVCNLFMPEVELRGFPADHFLTEYQSGFSNEVYPLVIPQMFRNHKFKTVAEFLYLETRVLLFALDLEGSGRLLLNPAQTRIGEQDLGLVMAAGLEDTFTVSAMGATSHTEKKRCECEYAWKCSCGGHREADSLLWAPGRLESQWTAFVRQSEESQSLADESGHGVTLLFASRNSDSDSLPSKPERVSLVKDLASNVHFELQTALLEREARGNEAEESSEGSQASGADLPRLLSVRSAVNKLLEWPPENLQLRPYPAVLVRQAAAIYSNLRDHTLDIVNLRKGHILICAADELSANLFYFLRSLRGVPGVPELPVVILHPEEVTVEQWGSIGMFPEVFLVRGSPLYDADLLRAGVTAAERIVVLSKFGKPVELRDSVQDMPFENVLATTDAYDSDVHSIIVASNLERLITNKRDFKAIVEFQHPQNMRHLKPHMTFNRSNVGSTDWSRHREAVLNFSPAYMEGRACSPFQIGFVLRALFYNSNALKLVELLIEGSHGEGEHGKKQRGVEQILVPPQFAGRSFAELFQALLATQSLLAVGLYRAPGTSGSSVGYVYTNPEQDSIVNASDLVFVL